MAQCAGLSVCITSSSDNFLVPSASHFDLLTAGVALNVCLFASIMSFSSGNQQRKKHRSSGEGVGSSSSLELPDMASVIAGLQETNKAILAEINTMRAESLKVSEILSNISARLEKVEKAQQSPGPSVAQSSFSEPVNNFASSPVNSGVQNRDSSVRNPKRLWLLGFNTPQLKTVLDRGVQEFFSQIPTSLHGGYVAKSSNLHVGVPIDFTSVDDARNVLEFRRDSGCVLKLADGSERSLYLKPDRTVEQRESDTCMRHLYSQVREFLQSNGIEQNRDQKLSRNFQTIVWITGETVFTIATVRRERHADFQTSAGSQEALAKIKLDVTKMEAMIAASLSYIESRRKQRI